MAAQELVPKTPDSLTENELERTFPAILVRAGASACLAADEFFSARISNPHTRTAYAHQVSRFLTWCENEGLELHQVTPGLAGRFLDELPGGAPTQNQALAGLRHFFDTLVARHAAVLNPFQSVRGVRHPHGEGRTPEVTVDQARQLLASIKNSRRVRASGPGGPRDPDLHRRPGRGHQSAPDAGSSRQRQIPVAAVCGKRREGPRDPRAP